MKKILLFVGIIVIIAMFISLIPNIFGGFEAQHNTTAGLNESDEYEAVSNLGHVDMQLLIVVGMLLLIPGLLIMFKVLS